MGGLMNKIGKFYSTTALPYVNADPHIGFALEVIQADIIARHHKFLGEEIVFNTGTDEHGLKIYRKAEEGKETQKICGRECRQIRQIKKSLNLDFTNFIIRPIRIIWRRQEFWGDARTKRYLQKKRITG